ncbi:hypothetical protein N9R04_00590 [Staphylococcus sp. SQ8-PEA]|uniref:Staphylococcal protein n=1 Tax=Staphylococcus marylandisciuri TaxID=2981529 RepID=A0ABT2QML0_9STAP|nr:hypothetical protein [Staphylococcus marylandisciuri]MCU5745217.1 hypothetical protein [Staphylococcus marylandisciuri]
MIDFQELFTLQQHVYTLLHHIELYHFAIYENEKQKQLYQERIISYVKEELERINAADHTSFTLFHHKYCDQLTQLERYPLEELTAGKRTAYIIDTQNKIISLYNQIDKILHD